MMFQLLAQAPVDQRSKLSSCRVRYSLLLVRLNKPSVTTFWRRILSLEGLSLYASSRWMTVDPTRL